MDRTQLAIKAALVDCYRAALRELELGPIPEAITFTYGLHLSPD